MVRSFTRTPVADDITDALINALLSGPSAGNTRSHEVLALTGDDTADYWDATLPTSRRESFPWPRLLAAPLLLIVYVQPLAYVDRYGGADKASTGLGDSIDAWSVPYWWVDGGAAVENVLIAVQAFELAACFFGQFEHEAAVRTRFGVPDTFRAVGTIAIGYSDGNDRPSSSAQRPRHTTEERTHRHRW